MGDIKTFAMVIEEFKELIVKTLGAAGDCAETEQIINRSLQLLKAKHLSAKADYRVRLIEELKALSPSGFDYIHWCNIQCAILYLRKLTKK